MLQIQRVDPRAEIAANAARPAPAFYVFNTPGPGFVLVAGDDQVTPILHDSYSSGNGQTYSLDAVFSYCLDGGNTWSTTYDDVMPNPIVEGNGGTLYLKVAPYFAGNIGTYLFDMSVSRGAATAAPAALAAQVSIYPTPRPRGADRGYADLEHTRHGRAPAQPHRAGGVRKQPRERRQATFHPRRQSANRPSPRAG